MIFILKLQLFNTIWFNFHYITERNWKELQQQEFKIFQLCQLASSWFRIAFKTSQSYENMDWNGRTHIQLAK